MKASVVFAALCVASASAFAPAGQSSRFGTNLNAKVNLKGKATLDAKVKKTLFNVISEMDLFEPVKNQNIYGARNSKKLAVGKIGANSYVPSGLTPSQYDALRKKESSVKEAKYKQNASKAFKILDFNTFYTQRGTDTTDAWKKKVTGGHDFAKTKYDWSGATQQAPLWVKEPIAEAKKKVKQVQKQVKKAIK